MIVTLAQLEEASIMQARAIKFYRKPKNRAKMAFSISMEERYVGQSPRITKDYVGGGLCD